MIFIFLILELHEIFLQGHAYGVTGARRVSFSELGVVNKIRGKEKVALIRLRNPWTENNER